MIKGIRESDDLPMIGQTILLASPRQFGEFWDLQTARLLVAHEGVVPNPIAPGDRWPTTYYWRVGAQGNSSSILITGNSLWASLVDLPLPDGAQHETDARGYSYVVQIGNCFVPQGGIGNAPD